MSLRRRREIRAQPVARRVVRARDHAYVRVLEQSDATGSTAGSADNYNHDHEGINDDNEACDHDDDEAGHNHHNHETDNHYHHHEHHSQTICVRSTADATAIPTERRLKMKWFASIILALSVFALPACSTVPSSTTPVFDTASAQRAVYSAKEGYGVAERLATAYASLTRCAQTAVQPCSDPAVVAQITKARNVARDSLAAAQTAVDTPGFGSDVISTALTAMNSGLAAFQSISNKYGR